MWKQKFDGEDYINANEKDRTSNFYAVFNLFMSRVWKEKFNGENYENSYEGKKIMSKVWKQKFNGENYGDAYEKDTGHQIFW